MRITGFTGLIPRRKTQDYPKARLLGIALKACAGVDVAGLAKDALQDARAAAIAKAFGSERWSGAQA